MACHGQGSFTYFMLKTGADHKQRWAKPAGAEAKPQTANWVVRNLQSYDSQGPPALQAGHLALPAAGLVGTLGRRLLDWGVSFTSVCPGAFSVFKTAPARFLPVCGVHPLFDLTRLQAEESMSEGKKGIESAAAGQTEADQQQEWV